MVGDALNAKLSEHVRSTNNLFKDQVPTPSHSLYLARALSLFRTRALSLSISFSRALSLARSLFRFRAVCLSLTRSHCRARALEVLSINLTS